MSDSFWRELMKQDRLEYMYEVFSTRSDATDKNVAIRLARFAEARMYSVANGKIIDLEDTLTARKRDK